MELADMPNVDQTELMNHLDLARYAATKAGHLINEMRFTSATYEKEDGSIVTDADRAAETLIRNIISERTPEISIWGEEFGRAEPTSDLEWIIDPIDGTTWFEMGSPIFGTLIGLTYRGCPVMGVIAMPATGEMVFASRGNGCFYTNPQAQKPQQITVRKQITKIAEARISSSGLHKTDIWPEKGPKAYALSRLPAAAQLFRLAGDNLQHALVARGKLDGGIDTAMHPWDNAAIIPCIVEAGGIVSGIEGQRDNILECGSLLSASSHELLEELVQILKP